MKKGYRRLLFAAVYLASLVAVALVAGYIGRNLTGTGPIPTRSAFAGRLPWTPDGDQRRFQFYYATNRDTDDEATFEGRGNKRGSGISTGTFEVRISPYMPITPRVWFDSRHMEWASREELSQDDSLRRLVAAVRSSPDKSVLVLVCGVTGIGFGPRR
jgi:hypothetical protein